MRDEEKSKEELIKELGELRSQLHTARIYKKTFDVYFDASGISVALLDRHFNFINVNTKYAKADNKVPADFVGKNHFDLYPSEEGVQIFQKVVEKKEAFKILARPFVYPDNPSTITYWDWTLTPILNAAGEVGILILCLIDVTEKQQLKNEMARLDRLNLVGQMASSIAHEVRNPLTSMKGFLQLLANKETDPQNCEYYELIINEADRVNSIIAEFLSIARDKKVTLKPTSLNVVLNSLYPLLASDAVKDDKRIVLKNGDIPSIWVNEKEIRQLIINLVRNGLEATAPGTDLTIGTYVENFEVVLYVKDEGPGIAPEVLDKLGTPFMTTKDKGTGLGLAVCYSIAERHHSRIDVQTSSAGTTFYVRFGIDCLEAHG